MGGDRFGERPEVRVFGPVVVGERSVTPRQRALLSALALHHEQGATVETVADAVWAGRPPASARASIQNHVARLRAEFGPHLIVTSGNRYHLDSDLDVARFEALGTLWLTRVPTVAAVADLDEALGLWRGAPYEVLVEHGPADVERTRLEHLRGQLDERLAIAHMLTGDHTRAIAGLTVRTRVAPFHERAWELLIAALFHSGRRTEALAAYEQFRQLVRAELSTEPSASTRRLRDAVEAADPLAGHDVMRLPASTSDPASRSIGGANTRCLSCKRIQQEPGAPGTRPTTASA